MTMDQRSQFERSQGRTPMERAGQGHPGQAPYPSYESYMAQRKPEYRPPPTHRPAPPSSPAAKTSRQQFAEDQSKRYPPPQSQQPKWPMPRAPEPRSFAGNPPAYRPAPARPSNRPFPSEQEWAAGYDPTNVQERSQTEQPDKLRVVDLNRSFSQSSRMTASTIGTIPDFPSPVLSVPSSSKSTPIGPPPSSRRAGPFYPTASHVSVIPEESSRAYASPLSTTSTNEGFTSSWHEEEDFEEHDMFYDETSNERGSVIYEGGDDSHLVRSASIGKRGKPSLIHTTSSASSRKMNRPSATPVQPQETELGKMEPAQTSSGTLPTQDRAAKPGLTPTFQKKFPSTHDLTLVMGDEKERLPGSGALQDPATHPGHFPMKRPPRLDLDAVRDAEARGSLTSLPDLIRRATRLATMLESGKRPTSRFDDLSTYLHEKLGNGENKPAASRRQSGLSDLLNTFPNPADKNRRSRGTWFRTTSWPMMPRGEHIPVAEDMPARKPTRRCCGMPMWLFFLVVVLLLCVVATAIVLPLEFFVFKNLGNHKSNKVDAAYCSSHMPCQNGGVSMISQGSCACICTNGFTGADCSQPGSSACVTTLLSALDPSSTAKDANVTMGDALPRLITASNTNFSIPLTGSDILAKFNAGNTSCIAQNSLVTFDGATSPPGDTRARVKRDQSRLRESSIDIHPIAVVTVTSTLVAVQRREPAPSSAADAVQTSYLDLDTSVVPAATSAPSGVVTTTATATTAEPTEAPGNTCHITQDVLDFARVVVLYVLQEGDLDAANEAQTNLQNFFGGATSATTTNACSNVSIGTGKSANLIAFTVNIGNGAVGQKNIARRLVSYGGFNSV